MATPPSSGSPGHNLQVVLVGSDATLEEEFRSALAGVRDLRGVLHFSPTYRHALEAIRAREPQLVVVEIDREVDELADFSRSLHEMVPGAVIAATFRPDQLEHSHSESAVIIELMRAEVRDFLRRPLSTTELRVVLERLMTPSAPVATARERGRISSFVSNKGGAGKSTLAVNVACSLARRHPDNVLLVDTSLQLGTCASMLDLSPTTTIVDAVRQSSRLDETLLRQLTLAHPSGLRLLAAPGDAIEAADVNDEVIARLLTLARRTFRHVIVDTFPILDSIVMAILDLSDTVHVVVQGMMPSVAGVSRLLPVLDGLGFPPSRQKLILNYNYRNFLGNLAPGDIAARLQRRLDYVVGYERRILVSLNTGSPYVLSASRWSRVARTIGQIAEDLDTTAVRLPREAPPAGAEDNRARLGHDRRRSVDRRVRDIGHPDGDRRRGDRRTGAAARALTEQELLR